MVPSVKKDIDGIVGWRGHTYTQTINLYRACALHLIAGELLPSAVGTSTGKLYRHAMKLDNTFHIPVQNHDEMLDAL